MNAAEPDPDPAPTRQVAMTKTGTGGTDKSTGTDGTPAAEAPASSRRRGRFWSVRRVPATLLALVLLGGSGLLLYDLASVRAGRPGMRWRRALTEDLATRPLDNVWTVVAAAVAVVLGVWLLALALTPGLRAVLTMRPGPHGLRAGLGRDVVERVLHDRAMAVPGVRSVRVRAKRHKAAVRAVAHFRELPEVRGDVEAALAAGVRELGLARPPAVAVHVVRPPGKR
ncbi:DUF6286 domain-containing protein [Streptomyces lichenis]|uniref:DUF6286 domain-containing protein n=1 Tax=Streptomyces lichenis TaxID=2306967 RepID=A0ABT0ICE1_9ACTN|nr:DUF6286 domain-containing protein [Streptomyces lichenis]MCK8678975.1 DUF6286 domain-containing protein [Streptomyces lichenis]